MLMDSDKIDWVSPRNKIEVVEIKKEYFENQKTTEKPIVKFYKSIKVWIEKLLKNI